MVYYYAHTGHKVGLERARRGITMINKLKEKGIETQLLVNDFRAGVALKDQYGLRDYVTIETIQDIDAIAQNGDSIIIDSDEDDHGRLVKYVSDFKTVMRYAHDENDSSVHGEILLRPDCQSDTCIEAVVVDDLYFQPHSQEERVLFFLRDYDHDKTILNHSDFFKVLDMELLLGNYFFVKYEDDLAKLFNRLHEPEEYSELIASSATVVTASTQTALEAKAAGAKVIFLDLEEKKLYPLSLLEAYGIITVKGFNPEVMQDALNAQAPLASKTLLPYDISPILQNF